MINKILAFIKKYIWIITAIIAIGGFALSIYQARISAKRPVLKYYSVKVSPEINDTNLQSARIKIENSLFQSVNNLAAQDSSLTYSEALDKILPISETVGNLSGGVVIVIQNQGESTARNLRINLTLGTPIENYEVFSNEAFSVVDENKTKGTIKIAVDRLTSGDKVQIALLFPGQYTVSLVASRFSESAQPTPSGTFAQMVATQTAMDPSKQNLTNSLNGFLQFYTENHFDNIQIKVFVSSDEVHGDIESIPKDTSKERNLFFSTF